MSGTVATSPAAPFSTAAFTDAEKADIRRFCGYPTYGAGPAGFQGWRFYTEYGLLEFRMNNLAAAEYANVRYYLSLLYPIETALSGAYTTLNVDTAAVFKRNSAEVGERIAHYAFERRRLCEIVGVEPGPYLAGAIGGMAVVI